MTPLAVARFDARRLRWPLVAVVAWSLLGPLAFGSLFGRHDPRILEAQALGSAAVLLALAHALLGRAPRDDLTSALPVSPGRAYLERLGLLLAAALAIPLFGFGSAAAHQALHGPWPEGLFGRLVVPLWAQATAQAVILAGLAAGLVRCGTASALVGGSALLLTRALAPEHDLLCLGRGTAGWGLAAIASAGVGWLTCTRDPERLATALRRGPLGGLLARGRGLLGGALLIGLPLTFGAGDPAASAGYPDDVVHVTLPEYRFRLPARQRGAAQALLDRAPAVHAAVSSACGVHAQVTVELSEDDLAPSNGHVVRLSAAPVGSASVYALARITAQALLERRLARVPARWTVARQGWVRHVALRASGTDAFPSRFHAAVLHARRRIDLNELFDPQALMRWRGPEARPALEEALWTALERSTAGTDPQVLAAIEALPGDLAPDTVWPRLLERLEVDREALRLALMTVLEGEVREDPRAQRPLPRLQVLIDVQEQPLGWRVLAIPDVAIPPGWTVVCRVRRTPPGAGPAGKMRAVGVGRDGRGVPAFFVAEPAVAGDRRTVKAPWVQVGLRPVGWHLLRDGLWEDWTPPAGPP